MDFSRRTLSTRPFPRRILFTMREFFSQLREVFPWRIFFSSRKRLLFGVFFAKEIVSRELYLTYLVSLSLMYTGAADGRPTFSVFVQHLPIWAEASLGTRLALPTLVQEALVVVTRHVATAWFVFFSCPLTLVLWKSEQLQI